MRGTMPHITSTRENVLKNHKRRLNLFKLFHTIQVQSQDGLRAERKKCLGYWWCSVSFSPSPQIAMPYSLGEIGVGLSGTSTNHFILPLLSHQLIISFLLVPNCEISGFGFLSMLLVAAERSVRSLYPQSCSKSSC